MTEHLHTPVLLNEVLQLLAPKPSEKYLDCTLGLGGHARAILEKTGPDGDMVGIDADRANLELAKTALADFSGRIHFVHTNFVELPHLHLGMFDLILADLGLSSLHLDDPSRGFSYRFDGPLDLRLDRTTGQTAAQFLAIAKEEEILTVLRDYGELYPEAKRLTRIFMEAPPKTTFELKALVEKALGWKAKARMAQVFQALRIYVNDELHAIDVLVDIAPKMLSPGGRLAIISFHSLEDRRVKQAFKALCEVEKDPITGKKLHSPHFLLRTPKAVKPSEDEIAKNPRSRSAVLRVLERAV